ncbi:MAG: FAD-dependent monooxygenase [Hyphomicrobiales bacterium]|nr:FAD-dependent monooxygenase [Hyphomicrobiales bacterium]MDE2113369.1 FAD-dependent monooxygenase [Hyphomicrobiales bacterium]
MASSTSQKIIIAGSGIVGMLFALRTKQLAGESVDILLCDATLDDLRKSGRASTIAAGPRAAFQAAGVWEEIADHVQAIQAMHITDSRLKDALRPTYLHLDGEVGAGEPFAHVVEEAPLLLAMRRRCTQAGIKTLKANLRAVSQQNGSVCVTLDDQSTHSGALLVAADGANSRARRLFRITTTGRDYHQFGVVATLQLQRPHQGIAVQHFLAGGPFAMLPLSQNRASIVWTLPTATARAYLQLSPTEFNALLQEHFSPQFGEMQLIGPQMGFPLRLQLARSYIDERFAMIGDAAHVVHPLAGQGANLGLADAIALADIIAEQARLGLDIGAHRGLTDYQRARRTDVTLMAAATDGLNRLFCNDSLPLRLLRDLGMGLVERLPRAKARIVAHAAGKTEASGALADPLNRRERGLPPAA